MDAPEPAELAKVDDALAGVAEEEGEEEGVPCARCCTSTQVEVEAEVDGVEHRSAASVC